MEGAVYRNLAVLVNLRCSGSRIGHAVRSRRDAAAVCGVGTLLTVG